MFGSIISKYLGVGMKKLLLASAFALLTSHAIASNWAVMDVSSDGLTAFLVNKDNYTSESGQADMWVAMVNIDKTQPDDVTIAYMTADCKSKIYMFSDITSYLKGKTISKQKSDKKPRKAMNGGIDWMMIDAVCRKDLDDNPVLSFENPKDMASSVQEILRELQKRRSTPF